MSFFNTMPVMVLRDTYHKEYQLNMKKKGPVMIPRSIVLKNGKKMLDLTGYHEDTVDRLRESIHKLLNERKNQSVKRFCLNLKYYQGFDKEEALKLENYIKASSARKKIFLIKSNPDIEEKVEVEFKKVGNFEMIKLHCKKEGKILCSESIVVYNKSGRKKKLEGLLDKFLNKLHSLN